MKFNRSIAAILVGTSIASPWVYAEEAKPVGFTISPSVGAVNFDRDSTLRNNVIKTLAIGYQFNSPWALELAYTIADTDIQGTNVDADVRQVQLDGLYHFNHSGDVTSYGVLGVGMTDFSTPQGDFDEEMVNAGVGIKWLARQALSFRSDVRAVRGLDSDYVDAMVRVGLTYTLGEAVEKNKAPVVQAPLDDDQDGVPNSEDQCLGTESGVAVDVNGCEMQQITDLDQDGVADDVDKCPDSELGAIVNSDGCYALEKSKVTLTLDVKFKSNSNELAGDFSDELAELAEFLRTYSQTNVVLEGHTDSAGAADYNQKLSERRARTIADLLVTQYGVSQSRVDYVGRGEDMPIADNSTAAGREKNRRVEAVVKAEVEKRVR